MNREKDIDLMKAKALIVAEEVNSLDSSFNESNENNAAELILKIKMSLTELAKEFDGVVVGKEFTAITNPIVEAFTIKVNAYNKYKGEK